MSDSDEHEGQRARAYRPGALTPLPEDELARVPRVTPEQIREAMAKGAELARERWQARTAGGVRLSPRCEGCARLEDELATLRARVFALEARADRAAMPPAKTWNADAE